MDHFPFLEDTVICPPKQGRGTVVIVVSIVMVVVAVVVFAAALQCIQNLLLTGH